MKDLKSPTQTREDPVNGLRVIDVSDPANMQEVGFYDTPGLAQGVAVQGSYVYVADWNNGLLVIDVSDPTNPQEVGFYGIASYAQGVAAIGSYAYVAYAAYGLQIVEFYGAGVEEAPNAEVRTPNAPTVVRGVLYLVESTSASPITSCLMDVSGRKVLTLRPGANDVRALAPGVYFVCEAQAQAQAIRRVVVTR